MGPHEPIFTKFGQWRFFIMLYRYSIQNAEMLKFFCDVITSVLNTCSAFDERVTFLASTRPVTALCVCASCIVCVAPRHANNAKHAHAQGEALKPKSYSRRRQSDYNVVVMCKARSANISSPCHIQYM